MRRITHRLVAGLVAAGLALLQGGCPVAPPAQNQAPAANAGANQTAAVNSVVTLTGLGTDPDGDTLTFAWSQISGTAVTLNSANAATASFTAPNVAGALVFQLTVSDGRGGTDTDTTTVNVLADAPPPPPTTLFIANFTGSNVTSYRNPAGVNGNIAPDTNLAGAQTLLAQPSDIIVDAAGNLLATNFGTASITGYDDAVNTNGNLAPDRNVQGAATNLVQPTSLAVNTASDLAFVADIGTDQIYVYANASTAALNGNLAPTRTIATTTSGDLNNPFGVNFGANDNLYVANNGGQNVLVFANASQINGNLTPTRIITSAVFTNIYDVFIDSSDRMYVVNATGSIFIFNNASTRNGNVAPDFTLVVQGAGFLTAIAVDAGGTGYIVDNAVNAVYAYDNIATRNGTLAPDRTIQGNQTQLAAPIRVFLLEP